MKQRIIRTIMRPLLIVGVVLGLLKVAEVMAGNIDPSNNYAWGTNVGWLNFNPTSPADSGGVTVYPDHLEGYVWAENVGWIKMGTNTGGGTHTYGNSSNTDYGVNRDCGSSQLSGSAWSTNVGWIKFDPTDGGVTVDGETGEFDGYAWGENIGWIHFNNTSGTAYHVEFVTNTLTIEATPKSYAVGCDETQVTVNVTDTGSGLTGLTINRFDGNAPNAPAGIADGQYWEITPTGSPTGFTVDLSLPHTPSVTAANARACRYDSGTSSWDCDEAGTNTSSDGSVVTRTGVTGFSIWAVGDVSQPLAATLANFTAQAGEDGVRINWETVSEVDNLGFNLYRTTTASLPETSASSVEPLGGTEGGLIQLNNELIAAQAPGSGQGSAYEWQDEAVEGGITYYYWLEDVDTNGNHTTHGPASATVNTPTAVTIGQLGTSEPEGLAAFASLMLMLVAGGWWLRRQS